MSEGSSHIKMFGYFVLANLTILSIQLAFKTKWSIDSIVCKVYNCHQCNTDFINTDIFKGLSIFFYIFKITDVFQIDL